MIEEKLKQAAALYSEFQELADRAARKNNELCEEYDLPAARLILGCIEDIDEYGVRVSWYETWSYGGYDEGTYDLTLRELDPETQESVFREKLEAIIAEKKKKDDADKVRKEAEERKQLARLQKKYDK